jgi:hypothetical protein
MRAPFVPTLEALEDRALPSASVSIPAAQAQPAVQLTAATTPDARTIAVSYTISGAPASSGLTFNIFRSANPNSLAGAVLLGTATVPASDTADLAVGTHTRVDLPLVGPQGSPVTALTPNPGLPFVVVRANGTSGTAWFETFVLGVVTHGFEIDPKGTLPQWETMMANTLRKQDGYQAVIAFNWTRSSWLPKAGEAVKAGNRLQRRIVAQADQLAAQHPGDVVDIQLIGHSRGGVVISRAAQDLNGTPDPALRGGFLHMTLLDPHPASDAFGIFLSYNPFNPLDLSYAVATYTFQLFAKDPQVVIPPNVQQAELFYQNTPVPGPFQSLLEELTNYWGEPPSDLINQSGRPIHTMNLTGASAPKGGLVGHSEVHQWYEVNVAQKGQTFTFFS